LTFTNAPDRSSAPPGTARLRRRSLRDGRR